MFFKGFYFDFGELFGLFSVFDNRKNVPTNSEHREKSVKFPKIEIKPFKQHNTDNNNRFNYFLCVSSNERTQKLIGGL